MTDVTLHRCIQVETWLGGRTTGRTVTVIASACRTGIVHPATTDEGCGGVAEMAIQRCRQVGVVLALRGCAIVAGCTVVDNAGVIEHRADKAGGVMADTAILAGRYVTDRLADREHIVVTGATVIHDAGMTEACRQEAGSHVTDMAVFVGRHVVRRRCLAGSGYTVVA